MSDKATRRTLTDGKPYYCTECELGWSEYIVCQEEFCNLETEAEARKRLPPVETTPDPERLPPAERAPVMAGDAP